jgi:hypothetical protein
MGFVDAPLIAGLQGLTVSGLGVTQKAAMELEVAAGSVTVHATGVTYTLSTAESKVFTADPTNPSKVFVGLISDGATTQVWVDVFVDDGLKIPADVPASNMLIVDLAWFSIAANETDLLNGDVNRRVYQ